MLFKTLLIVFIWSTELEQSEGCHNALHLQVHKGSGTHSKPAGSQTSTLLREHGVPQAIINCVNEMSQNGATNRRRSSQLRYLGRHLPNPLLTSTRSLSKINLPNYCKNYKALCDKVLTCSKKLKIPLHTRNLFSSTIRPILTRPTPQTRNNFPRFHFSEIRTVQIRNCQRRCRFTRCSRRCLRPRSQINREFFP